MVEAFASIYSELETVGHNPRPHIFNNECSRAVQNFLNTKNTTRQNAEAHHRTANVAKPSVKSTKYHIISYIAIMDAD